MKNEKKLLNELVAKKVEWMKGAYNSLYDLVGSCNLKILNSGVDYSFPMQFHNMATCDPSVMVKVLDKYEAAICLETGEVCTMERTIPTEEDFEELYQNNINARQLLNTVTPQEIENITAIIRNLCPSNTLIMLYPSPKRQDDEKFLIVKEDRKRVIVPKGEIIFRLSHTNYLRGKGCFQCEHRKIKSDAPCNHSLTCENGLVFYIRYHQYATGLIRR